MKKTTILLAALLMLGIAQSQGAQPPLGGGSVPGDPIAGASTLREYIELDDDPVDPDIADAINKWGRALYGN